MVVELCAHETLIYLLRYTAVPAPDMAVTEPDNAEQEFNSLTPILQQLRRPILEYRIIIAIIKGDVGATYVLKDVLNTVRDLRLPNPLLALGPTTPLSIETPTGSKILWATFLDNYNSTSSQRLTIVQPNHLTDVSLNLEKLSKTRNGRVPLIIGDFLDNILSVSTTPAALYSFLCRLFTRIRTNNQTAFLLATDDMHDTKKTAILKRFADLIIEYNSVEDMAGHRIEARLLDRLKDQYSYWNQISQNPGLNIHPPRQSQTFRFGRQNHLPIEQVFPLNY